MGNKKTQSHIQNSMGNMVSKAALTQLAPQIEEMIREMGQKVAQQQLETIETIYTRLVVAEKILMEKLSITQEDLINRVADVEDESNQLSPATEVSSGDLVRLEVWTKASVDTEFAGHSRLKVINVGSGRTIGKELETSIFGMKVGESKEVTFGEGMTAKFQVNRVARRRVLKGTNEVQPAGQ